MEKSFKDCNLKFLEKTFGIEQIDTLPDLDSWLATPSMPSAFEEESLLHLRSVLNFNIHDWNEYELDSHFIGPIFTLVNFSNKKFNHYSQRYLQGQVGDYQLFGKPDGIVSAGRREPETPYFAFQEYKKELDPNGDPAGQALAAMLVGQSLNDDPSKPIYGCYVNGRDWYFMVLLGKEYSISQDFSATTDDIFKVFATLKALKEIVTELTA
ncbi:MAG: hypothetical protein RLZZ306_1815 [Bacteroidota bacterium]|jgi:hypothetical protein